MEVVVENLTGPMHINYKGGELKLTLLHDTEVLIVPIGYEVRQELIDKLVEDIDATLQRKSTITTLTSSPVASSPKVTTEITTEVKIQTQSQTRASCLGKDTPPHDCLLDRIIYYKCYVDDTKGPCGINCKNGKYLHCTRCFPPPIIDDLEYYKVASVPDQKIIIRCLERDCGINTDYYVCITCENKNK